MGEHEKQEQPKDDDKKVGDLSRDHGNGGFFSPPLWLGKIIKVARGR